MQHNCMSCGSHIVCTLSDGVASAEPLGCAAASAMEMSAISAMNSALLVRDRLFGEPEAAAQSQGQHNVKVGASFTENSAAAAAA